VRIYRNIENVSDIRTALFVLNGADPRKVVGPIAGILDLDYRVLKGYAEASDYCLEHLPDITFVVHPGQGQDVESFHLCSHLRQSGYSGILILVTDSIRDAGGVSGITSTGFDNYALLADSPERMEDTIHWAVLNRKRKNKYVIQFDQNPDSFFTVDRQGRVYDINSRAAGAAELTPKEIVRNGINIDQVGTLKSFRTVIRPLITPDNVDRVFSHTAEEEESIFQLKTRVHNVPTIGLVATVVKSDITRTMLARTLDILVHSITMLSERDNYTAGHSSRVFYYCMNAAGELGLTKNKKFIRDLYFAALLHDIGKIGIKDVVLMKPGKLSRREFNELATHSVKGYKILKRHRFLDDSIELVRSHHERPDGRGYPDKLMGNRISLGASIISVADGYDAMTTNRPYRNALTFEKAVSEIRDNIGSQYNGDAARAFLSVLTPELTEETRSRSRRPLEVISRELLETVS
jgi:HD-GYP domain-containing protein (c-di-GMP phosphodiesterase class II)